MTILQADDSRLDDYRHLRDRDLSGARRAEGLFVGETIKIAETMLERPGLTRSVLASERMSARVREMIEHSASKDVPLFIASDATLEETAGFSVHRGVLAIGLRASLDTRRADAPPFTSGRLLVALDGLNNMDNVGAIFRSAAAFGVDGVLLSRDCHDPLYRKAIRVSMGHALRVPFAWSDDLASVIHAFRRARPELRVLAAACSPHARDIAEFESGGVGSAPSTLVIIGNEHSGISQSVLAAATDRVRIPIAEGVDSLNAAIAASIVLHRLSSIPRT
ncbi:MAG: RNA methyltransferase [Phycisphaerales bacterium]|nr:RNA methyltransferase [Phycisphaerales bacterium]